MFNAAAQQPIDAALLAAMTTALSHRGPDGDGFHVEPGIGLGHRRLAIIDPAAGEQPMFNEDGSVAIVFNGMIYNYQALHTELVGLGHVFRTRCDTETIIHAWEEWGTDCLARLNGMFAFAIWDRKRATLFLARDRLGKKPLHYATRPDGSLVFASELAAFAPVPDLDRRLDARAVDDFFTYGYVPDPATIFRGIHKLPAGHFLLLHHDRAEPVPQRYWHATAAVQEVAEAEAISQLRAWLDDIVAKRLIADVPLGAFLSGGVDSSAVVAVAAGLRSSRLDTFTIGFGGAEDETAYAEQVAARYDTIQHSDTATLDYLQGARDLGRVFGEPFGDSSAIPTFSVCALASRHAKVAVSGDGGDEVLGGYRRYQWHRMTEAVRAWLPAGVRRHVVGQLARIYPKMDFAPRWLRAKYTLTELSLDSALGYFRMVTKVHHDTRRALFAPAVLAELDGYDPGARIEAAMAATDDREPLRQAQIVDIDTYLVGDILTKVDRASMANSLEVRAPLLDYRFVEWGLGLPAALKLHGGTGKYVFKRAMEDKLPREILYRPKQGFATSLAGLFRAQAATLRARLLGPAMQGCGIFRTETVARLLDEHVSGGSDHSHVLWLLLVFEGFLDARHSAPHHAGELAMAHG
jgi:asparagine synthase (glutamine-hydrolysing)